MKAPVVLLSAIATRAPASPISSGGRSRREIGKGRSCSTRSTAAGIVCAAARSAQSATAVAAAAHSAVRPREDCGAPRNPVISDMRRSLPVLVVFLLAGGADGASTAWRGRTAAYFGVTLVDGSHEGELNGPRADETARIELVEAQLADALAAEGLELVDLAPVSEELARTGNPADCNDCAIRMAQRLGAEYAVVAEVHKVSNLILSMTIELSDAGTGDIARAMTVDIRGNNEESWTRGMRYILKNGIFTD